MVEHPIVLAQNPGVETYGPFAIPDGTDRITARISDWPQATRTLALHIETTVDGGVTWDDAGSTNPDGGGHAPGRDGTRDSSIALAFGEPIVGASIRVTATVAGGRITTQIRVRLDP